MATKNESNHQGQVKDPEHDGRLKGHKGGEAPKAHEDASHPDEKHAAPKKAAPKKHDEPAHEDDAKKAPAKAHKEPAHEEPEGEGKKAEPKKAEAAKAEEKPDATSDKDADLKSREYTDAQGKVHHHTKAYMESHKGE